MNFIIAQLLGLVVAILCIVMTHFKKMSFILISEIAANVLTAIQYFLLGGISGSCLCIVSAVHTFVLFVFARCCKTNVELKKNIIFCIFLIIYIFTGFLNYKNYMDIFLLAASVLFSLAVIQTRANKYRIINLIKIMCNLFYDLYTGAFTNVITRLFSGFSCGVAIWRLDLKKFNKKAIG